MNDTPENTEPSPEEQIRMNGAEIGRKAEELHAAVCELLHDQPIHSVLMVFSEIYAGSVAQFAQLQLQAEMENAPAGVAFSPEEKMQIELSVTSKELTRFGGLVRKNREALQSNIITKAS